MPLLSLHRIHRSTHRAVAAAIALSLLSMPVTYRGGADAAHAHTIFQLWEDVRIGSFAHHAPEGEPEGHTTPDDGPERHEATPVESRPGATSIGEGDAGTRHPAADQGFDARPAVAGHGTDARPPAPEHGATTDRDEAGLRERASGAPTGTVAVGADPDAPVASSAFTPSVRGTALVLPAAVTWPEAESFVSAGGRSLRVDGITDSPIAPPPRRAAQP